ncbi:23S rRNA methyluridine methyltransferase [Actinobacillus equuli]|nr:23S rRNA methyluridine methyltransferase [Actinobacillus equuli]
MVSLNIQPQHAAILEGETEIFLTEKTTIEENLTAFRYLFVHRAFSKLIRMLQVSFMLLRKIG